MIELLGILLPPLIDLVNRKIMDQDIKFWMSVIICSIFGLLLNFIETDGFKGYMTLMNYADGIGKSIIMVFGFAQLSYHAVWKKTEMHLDSK